MACNYEEERKEGREEEEEEEEEVPYAFTWSISKVSCSMKMVG